TNEQAVVDWFQAWMNYFTLQVYKAAMAENQKDSAHPCEYIINPDLGKAFGVKYDTPNCEKMGQLFAGPAQPTAQDDFAVGTQAAHTPLAVEPAVAETLERLPAYAEIALSEAVLGAIVPAAIVTSTEAFQVIAPYAGRAFLLTAEAGAEVAG